MDQYVRVFKKTSMQTYKEWKKNPKGISFLWIDGAHDFRSVRQDFYSWQRFVRDGGTIAVHDILNIEGPRRLFLDYLLRSRRFVCFKVAGEIAFFRKKKPFKITTVFKKDSFNLLSLLRNFIYLFCFKLFLKIYTPKFS